MAADRAVRARQEKAIADELAAKQAVDEREKRLTEGESRVRDLTAYIDRQLSSTSAKRVNKYPVWELGKVRLSMSNLVLCKTPPERLPFDVLGHGSLQLSVDGRYAGGNSIWMSDAELAGDYRLYGFGFASLMGPAIRYSDTLHLRTAMPPQRLMPACTRHRSAISVSSMRPLLTLGLVVSPRLAKAPKPIGALPGRAPKAGGGANRYFAPLRRLAKRDTIWRLLSSVLPPFDHGTMWSASISSMGKCSPVMAQKPLCCS